MKRILYVIGLVFLSSYTTTGFADAPAVKTPAPVIYLADNLDEKDNLGWCIDTQGRGFSDRLHAHSCKPRGGDVQFSFNEETGQIMSVAFEDFCMVHQPGVEHTFGLVGCDSNVAEQQFAFDASTGQISLADQPEKCVVVGDASRSAGPFMSRTLLLDECSAVDAALKVWVVSK